MAYAKFSFDARGMGDSSSNTTSYIAEIVSCSNTSVPLQINGYTFRTTVSNAPKSGEDIEIVFEGVPANLILPANYKLKVTGNKNGNPIVRYQDCQPNELLICAEAPAGTCTINNVSIGQPICSSPTNILLPYAFSTTNLGLHKLEIYRILPDGQPPVLTKSVNVNVTTLNILQTGTINLDALNSDNYRLYVSALDESEEAVCLGTSNITLLSCGGTSNCVSPTFDVQFTSPTCNGLVALSNGSISIKNIVGGTKVRYCNGQVWACSNDYNSGIDITSLDSFVVAQNIGSSPSLPFDYYTVRVYKDASCFTDKVIKMSKPECGVNLCGLGEVVYNGEPTQKEYSYKNTTNQAQTLFIRLEPTTPLDFTIKKDGLVVYSTECSGINTTNCTTCSQGGVICASIVLNANQTVDLFLDSTCSTSTIDSWKLKTSCSSITECLSVQQIGQQAVCGITLPSNGINFTCNSSSNLVDLEVTSFYGAISNEYQFGYDLNNQWLTGNDVTWENTNKRISIPKNKSITVWLRDKNNTGCYTQFNVTTPNCINIIPKLKQNSLVQFFNQTGNVLTVDATDTSTSDNYEASYKYLDDQLVHLGSFDRNSRKLTLPLTARKGVAEIILKDTTTGQVSNKVYYNVIDEELLFIGTSSNICMTGSSDTFLSLSYNNISALLPYIVEVRDALTSAVLYTQEVADGSDIKIRHTETNTPVIIQAYSKNNPLKGSQQTGLSLVKQNCTGSVGSCCIENVAFTVNQLGTGSQVDSIGIYYKANCINGYRIFIENETTRGQYDLYNTVTTATTTTLTSPYNSFNYRIVQALASRVWRNKDYKIKIEFTNPSGNILSTAEFIVNVTSSTALNTPFSVFNCSSGSNNSCGLIDKDDYGDWNNATFDLQSRFISGKWIAVTAEKAYANTTDRYFPRGINFVDNNSNITFSKTFPKSCFDQTTTDFGGLVAPTGLTAPNGYIEGRTADNSLYYELGVSQPSYPCNQGCSAYTGIIPSQSGSTVWYPAFIYERNKPALANTAAGFLSPFTSRDEAIALITQYYGNNSAVNGSGYKASSDFVTTIRNGVYTQPFIQGDYLLNNNIYPFTLGVAQCGFFVAPSYKSDGTTPYGLNEQYRIITIDPCGVIINIELFIVNVNTGGTGGVSGTMSQIAGSQPTFVGTINTNASKQNNTANMNIAVTNFANGRVSLTDTVTSVPNDGRVVKYLIKTQTWVDNLTGYTFDPAFPILIQKFHVNASAPDTWQNNGMNQAYSFIVID